MHDPPNHRRRGGVDRRRGHRPGGDRRQRSLREDLQALAGRRHFRRHHRRPRDRRRQAQLVDGNKNNKVSLHVRNLAANTMYPWHVHEGTCAAPGAPVAGWTYRTQDLGANGTLTFDESGNANTKGKSATFNTDPTKSYSVNVHVTTLTNRVAAGTIIACGDPKASKASGKSKPNKPHPPQAQGPAES
jgi:hypothetical protein